jgi:hypothetical protein
MSLPRDLGLGLFCYHDHDHVHDPLADLFPDCFLVLHLHLYLHLVLTEASLWVSQLFLCLSHCLLT